MIGILQTLRQLLGYLLVATLLFNPIGFYLIFIIKDIKKKRYEYYIWLLLDRLACSICHKTTKRTISGWSGQWQHQSKRYKYQAIVINWLAYKVAGEKNHCIKAYQWEFKKGWVNYV